ncbi:Interleukin-20 receptor subunit alpha [Oryzias melastigma]|uniref:Interleukin-20 receptor subunit alpha n=1 Tax=Oryzias melastigma TaxID=30732 RepID=A0A3B3DVE3_ORYME|nr:interleukin-20 receptor subunit alpha [Oryzias melastigma]KAF6735923.1 Interleukin-20 receptor subunit alpha [Oryzias melastigma]
MWTVLVLMSLLGLTCTVASFPPSPINVSFSSVNLRNVLQWLPGDGTPDDAQYTVQYAIYGETVEEEKQLKWREVRQCTAIVRTWCDLSAQTSDLEEGYFARVRSMVSRMSSKWTVLRSRFDPKEETSFGPPSVSVEVHNNTATVTLKGPTRYQLNNQTPAIYMATIYKDMTYNLSVHNTHLDQTVHYVVQKGPFKYRLLSYNTKYCFSAQSRLLLREMKCQRSAWYCITTAQDPLIEQLQRVIVGIVVPFLFICVIVVAGFVLYQYMAGKGQKNPISLGTSIQPSHPLWPHLDPHIPVCPVTKISVTPEGPPHYSKEPVDSPPSYSPQRPAEPEEHPDDSSVEYGDVFVAATGDKGRGDQTKETAEGQSSPDDRVQGGSSYCPQNSTDLRGHSDESIVLSPYVSQKPRDLPTSHSDPSDSYGVVTQGSMQEPEAEDGEGVPFLSESRRMPLQFREEGNLIKATTLNNGRAERETGNHLEPYVTKPVINLEDVFFQQNPETDWDLDELERDGSDDILSNWNLTISMDKA